MRYPATVKPTTTVNPARAKMTTATMTPKPIPTKLNQHPPMMNPLTTMSPTTTHLPTPQDGVN